MTTELQLRKGFEADGMSEAEIERALDQHEAANPDDDDDDEPDYDAWEVTIEKIGSLDVEAGHDQYVLLTRKDADLSPEQAESWLLRKVYRQTDRPGAYYCTNVTAVRAYGRESQCICTIQHRYDI